MLNLIIDRLRNYEFRGKFRLFDPWVPRSGIHRVQVYGAWMELDLSDHIQRLIYLGSVGIREVNAVKRNLRPGSIFVDVGANVGFFTALANNCVGSQGRVIAYEPSPYAFQKLATVIQVNALSNVTAVQAGLSDHQGHLRLSIPPGSLNNHSPTMASVDSWLHTEVAVDRLDEQLEALCIDRIDLLKVDVEGHEPKVFAGARRALADRRIRAVLCEFNDYWLRQSGSSPAALWELLKGAGFRDEENLAPEFAPGCIDTHILILDQ